MLHGVWAPGSGLMLWRAGRDGDPAGAAASGDELAGLPRSVARAFARTPRHRTTISLPTDDGEVRATTIRTIGVGPADAVEMLQRMPDRPELVSGELRYLAHVVAGLAVWARSGRVVPALTRVDDEWWVRWQPMVDRPQRAWRAELLGLMPPVQVSLGDRAAIFDDLVAELVDPLVRSIIGRPPAAHKLTEALIDETPIAGVGERDRRAFERWRDSVVDDSRLVLRLVEPDPVDTRVAPLGAAVETEPEDDVLWTLEILIQDPGAAPVSLREVRARDPLLFAEGARTLDLARTICPILALAPESPSGDLLLPTVAVLDLIERGIPALTAADITVLLPREWTSVTASLSLQVRSPALPKTGVEGGVGMPAVLAYDWRLALGDVELTEEELDRLSTASAELVRLRGQWVRADPRAIAAAVAYMGKNAPPPEPTLGDTMALLAGGDDPDLPPIEVTGSGWAVDLLRGDLEPEPVEMPPDFRGRLRPYQQRGVDWLAFMTAAGLGAVLADDMGLGKTVQLLGLLAAERAREAPGATLLIAPMSVIGNWEREAARFAPGLRVLVQHGSGRATEDALVAGAAAADLVITTYALCARDIATLARIPWRRVVLDEAQHVKNPATAAAKAVRRLPARHRVALTGTPVENRLSELWAALDVVNPGMLGPLSQFHARYAVPIEREGDQDALAALRRRTAPFILRRVKTDTSIIADLPEKFEMTVRANLTREQAALYRSVVDDSIARIAESEGPERKGLVLATLTRLKQVCNHPAHYLDDGSPVVRRGAHRSGKLELLDDILDAALADGEKVLLFTQFRQFGDLVVGYLTARYGEDVPFLHGGVARKRRDAMVERFQTPDGPPIMMLSLKAGGTGLNLTAANHVVHLDRWWNPAVENQATDRAFRIGQGRDVQVRKLVCVGTIEERIDELLERKQGLADDVVGVGERWITEMDDAELKEIFALSDVAVAQ